MEFSSTKEEREDANRERLEVISDDYKEMVALIARSPLLLEDANVSLRGLTAQLVILFLFVKFLILICLFK